MTTNISPVAISTAAWDLYVKEHLTQTDIKPPEKKHSYLTILDTLACVLEMNSRDIDNGASIIDTFIYRESFDIYSKKHAWQKFRKPAQEMLDFWGRKFMIKRLSANNVEFSRWQTGVIRCVNECEDAPTLSDFKILVTLPRFTGVEKELDDLAENFQPWDMTIESGPATYKLVKKIQRKSNYKTLQTWYCFSNTKNQLFILPVFVSRHYENTNIWAAAAIDALLALNNGCIEATIDVAVGDLYNDRYRQFNYGLIRNFSEIFFKNKSLSC